MFVTESGTVGGTDLTGLAKGLNRILVGRNFDYCEVKTVAEVERGIDCRSRM